jgi:hypothetical protein
MLQMKKINMKTCKKPTDKTSPTRRKCSNYDARTSYTTYTNDRNPTAGSRRNKTLVEGIETVIAPAPAVSWLELVATNSLLTTSDQA